MSLDYRYASTGIDWAAVCAPIGKPAAFWIIWNPTYHTPPKVKFATQSEAESVAASMAVQFSPDTFHVLKVVSTTVVNTPVTVTRY